MTGLIVIPFAIAWVAIGLTYGVWMGRRGYDLWSWCWLGVLFGPVVIPLAHALQFEPRATNELRWVSAPAQPGPRVLVGIDGSADSIEAVRSAVRLFGPRLGGLVIATVIDYDTARFIETGQGEDDELALQEAFARADDAAGVRCTHVVLTGVPVPALLEAATRHEADIIVIGARGHGASKRVLGSTADRLTRDATLPVLVAKHEPPLGHVLEPSEARALANRVG
jgi:nucleotide-binding universal stress UspA family protein